MTLTKERHAEIDRMHSQSTSEKCEWCNREDGYHHLCKGKNCACLFCKGGLK